SLVIPPPPISTLFAYTTLFRSHRDRIVHVVRRRNRDRIDLVAELVEQFSVIPITRDIRMSRVHLGSPRVVDVAEGDDVLLRHTIDRKSTRLNSSHVKISYAVFC